MEVVFRVWLMERYLVQEKCLLIFWSIRTCVLLTTRLANMAGPPRCVFSQANLPGQIYYISDLPNSTKTKLNVVTEDLEAPMGSGILVVLAGLQHQTKRVE